MKIVSVGGGPAGLYLAISMKRRDPTHEVVVVERNRPGDTFGWGVVFSDQTLDRLRANDPESARQILDSFAHWDDIDVHFKGRTITSGGHGFCGIGRRRLLNILQDRARALGVELRFETEVDDLEAFADASLIVASDGLNSRIRERFADAFRPSIEVRANKYVWLGTPRRSRRSPSSSRRPSTAGSGRTPIVSSAIPRPSSSNAARRPGGAWGSRA